jgi:IS5 family transposase
MSICESGLDSKAESRPITINVPENHPLIRLAQAIPWLTLFNLVLPDLKKTKKGMFWLGRKLKVRIHLAVYILQKLTDKTDRQMEWELKDNAVYQIFCGFGIVKKWHIPDHTKIEEFRSRLSAETQKEIANIIAKFAVSMGFADPTKMDLDSTIQEPNMSYPSDANLLIKLSVMASKVYKYLIKKFYNEESDFDLKGIKAKARAYFFSLNKKMEVKQENFKALYWAAYFQIIKVTELSFTKICLEGLPWNIRDAALQIMEHGKKFLEDAKVYIDTGKRVSSKVFSFHLKQVACFNKGKAGKGLQFGRCDISI